MEFCTEFCTEYVQCVFFLVRIETCSSLLLSFPAVVILLLFCRYRGISLTRLRQPPPRPHDVVVADVGFSGTLSSRVAVGKEITATMHIL